MIGLYNRLKKKGVLSINQRNADYVLQYNARKHFPIVDDKLQTKRLAMKAGIAVPELYHVVNTEHQIQQLKPLLEKHQDFVIKPAHGAGGDGILVITSMVKGRFRKVSGELISFDEIAYHISCSLSGAYSLSGHPDHVLIEHRVEVDPVFESISHQGVPDIRIIVFQGYPVMAMVRLPTQQSEGKANLHQGAIGVGIDLATGKTLGGVHHNDPIDFHPDTLNDIAGLDVPHWQAMLQIAANSYELTQLGYLGVDIVLDKVHGPLMLELNARPGLNIQIANRQGLVNRFDAIENNIAKHDKPLDPKTRIAFSQATFT